MAEKITYPFLPEDKCLSQHQFFDYIDGNLNAADMHFVEKHLLSCPMCSDAMEGFEKVKQRDKVAAFSPDNYSKKVVGKTDIVQPKIIPLHSNRRYYALAAGLVLIISVSLYLKYYSPLADMESAKVADLAQKDSTVSVLENPKENKDAILKNEVSNSIAGKDSQKYVGNGLAAADAREDRSLTFHDSIGFFRATQGEEKDKNSEQQAFDQTSTGASVADIPAVRFALEEKQPADDDSKGNLDGSKAEEKKLVDGKSRDEVETSKKQKAANEKEVKADQLDNVVNANVSQPTSHYNAPMPTTTQPTSPSSAGSGTVVIIPSGGIVTQSTISDKEATVSKNTDTSANAGPKFYPLKATEKDLSLSYENGVKMLDSGQAAASLVFFDQVLTDSKHKNFEDAQWKKSLALIQLNRKAEAKILLQEIEKKGGKYANQSKEELKKL